MLISVKHLNIISLKEAFIYQDLYLIYKHLYINITLKEIQASLLTTFRDYKLAIIYKEVSFRGPLYSSTHKYLRF